MVESATEASAATPGAAEREERVPASVYFSELWGHKRLLFASLVGLGVGFGFTPYVSSIMAPHLIQEFGWSRASFAAINGLVLVVVLLFPLIGRINDLLGVRRTALIGVIAMPLAYAAFSTLTGDMKIYIAIFLAQVLLCITTTAVIYTRLVVHYIVRARGLALAIVASGPAFFGAIAAPLLNNFVEANGWRDGFLVAAAVSGVLGILALAMLPTPRQSGSAPPLALMKQTKADYAVIFGHKAFWILLGAILLCNLPTVLALSQLTLLLLENGISTASASGMLAAYATGTLIGRFGCGMALDRLPMHLVCALGMGLPAIGLALFASPFDAPVVLTVAVLFLGLANGAEGDLIGYVIAHKFGTRVYSSVFGFMSAAMGITSAIGAILLAATLAMTNTFTLFLIIAAVCATLGGLLLLTLKGVKPYVEPAAPA